MSLWCTPVGCDSPGGVYRHAAFTTATLLEASKEVIHDSFRNTPLDAVCFHARKTSATPAARVFLLIGTTPTLFVGVVHSTSTTLAGLMVCFEFGSTSHYHAIGGGRDVDPNPQSRHHRRGQGPLPLLLSGGDDTISTPRRCAKVATIPYLLTGWRQWALVLDDSYVYTYSFHI